jgi:hypothetical protein
VEAVSSAVSRLTMSRVLECLVSVSAVPLP